MKYWTNKELARLKQACEGTGYLTQHLSQFPGRTIESLRKQAHKQGWSKGHVYPGRPPVSQDKVMKLLERRDMCRADIAKALGIAKCTTSEILKRLRESEKVYLKERCDGRGATKVWSRCDRAAQEMLRASPFAVAAGVTREPSAPNGRIYHHLIDDEELEAA